jgi:hypothetical protein
MPRPVEALPQEAIDAAAALLSDEFEQPAAPQEENQRPVPERSRTTTGQFAPRTPEPQAQPAETGQQPTQTPEAEPETDYRVLWEEERRERTRLQGTYNQNTVDQRAALDAAKREATAAREEAARIRQETRDAFLQEMRDGVASMHPNHPDRAEAVINLAALERKYLAEDRAALDAERQAQREAREATEQETQAQEQERADLGAKVGAWTVVDTYTQVLGQQLRLAPDDVKAVMEQFQTPELALFMRDRPSDQVVDHIRYNLGPRVDAALRKYASQRTEGNRQAVLAEGIHGHSGPIENRPPEPEYNRYRNGASRPGPDSAAKFIMAGGLDADE